MTEKINLEPGNWFELRTRNPSKTIEYDIDSFKCEILNQIETRNDKLNFINISFGSKYNSNNIESIDFCLDKDKFKNMIKILQTEKRSPILAFHGTDLKAVEAIIRDGYKIGGLDSGVNKLHGSMYGAGVYTSPFYDKAMYYTKKTDDYVYVLVNMVLVGTVKLIPPANGKNYTDFSNPINGFYADNSNTRVVFGLEQIICADTKRVFPIAIMKIKV